MDALGYASDRAVRAILTAICDDAWVKSKALDYLRIIEPQAFEQAKLEVLNPGFKRKAHVGLSICVQCKEPFDEQDNRRRDCKYHSGESRHRLAGTQCSPWLNFHIWRRRVSC